MTARRRGRVTAARLAGDLLDASATAAGRWLPRGTLERRLAGASRAARAAVAPRMQPLVEALADARPAGALLQIGFSGDPERSPRRALIGAPGWRTVIAEPHPVLFARLAGEHRGRSGVCVDDVAVTPKDGEQPFYYLTDATPRGTGPPHPAGSLRRERIVWRRGLLPDFDDRFVATTVKGLSFAALCARHAIDRLDVLALDTDGDDIAILGQADLAAVAPVLIVAHTGALPAGVRAAGLELLHAHGYATIDHGEDTWAALEAALRGAPGAGLAAAWGAVRDAGDPREPLRITRFARAAGRRLLSPRGGRVAPVGDADRRYLERGYDDRVPLPPGAAEYLRQDNPRLAELRHAYAALDVPVRASALWQGDRLAAELTLPHFRGDNPYVWQSREPPQAMAGRLAAHLRYLEATAPPELVSALAEDGMFGCWTTEIPGFGRVSRDLLDSIGELAFLEARLGLRDRTRLRVLDIGAGYGRLAHRMAAAFPSLTDYCCVDAIPESTFLAEYYLAFRGCVPPARVVALPDVETALSPGSFDLAVNVHSFSECTLAAIEWWLALARRLEIPHLFVVPNEAEGILSREADGDVRDALPAFAAAGYQATVVAPAIGDARFRELTRIHDNHWMFALHAGAP